MQLLPQTSGVEVPNAIAESSTWHGSVMAARWPQQESRQPQARHPREPRRRIFIRTVGRIAYKPILAYRLSYKRSFKRRRLPPS